MASAYPAWLESLLRPIRAFRLSYVPVVMVYFAYGALGLIDVTRDLWIKESLSLTPSQLAGIGVWLSLPWTVKMVFGELVDTVPIFGSQRKSYILIGAAFMAAGLLTLAGAAGGWLDVRASRPALRSRRHADRHRHRRAGRGGGRDVDRGGRAHRRGRQRAPGRRRARRARHGAGARPARAVGRRPRGRRTVGLARAISCRARTCS